MIMETIKIDVSVEVPQDLYCSRGAGMYENMIQCRYCEWDEAVGKDLCVLFNEWLEQTNDNWKDSMPCKQCRDARAKKWKEKIEYGGTTWLGKMKRSGRRIGMALARILTWKKRSN